MATTVQRDGRGGGVIIYVKNEIKYETIQTKNVEGIIESCGIRIGDLNIVNIYRPPSGRKAAFVEQIIELMEEMNGGKVIIGGDYNINFMSSTTCMTNVIEFYDIKPQLKGVTRPESGTCIDNYCTNVQGKYWITNISFSDHLVIACNINTSNKNKEKEIFKHRQMKEKNWQMFNQEIKTITIEGVENEEKWQRLSDKLRDKIDLCFPWKMSKKEYKFTMSSGLMKSRDKKNALLKDYKQKKITKQIYINYNNLYRNLIKRSKEMEFKQKLANAKNNGKKKWEILKKELHITKEKELIKEIISSDRRISSNKLIAKSFKNHFETCATTLADSLPDGELNLDHIPQGQEWTFQTTSVYELIKIIKGMENKNSCGHDSLSNRMVKNEKNMVCNHPMPTNK